MFCPNCGTENPTGAFCKIKGLVIAGLVLTIIYSLVFCPVWVTLLLIALHITMIVFISIVKNEYKEYTRNPEAYAQKKA
ncbi:MAG: zinc ribbon domain-containing protein [Ruminococcaceae bacterium]|nr:zinc ribbon domain-containing protein [Oscillospiraceae bacterium]